MTIKLSKRTRAAFKKYYTNCKEQRQRRWDKYADLKNIFDSLPKNCIAKEACAGTFLLTWKHPHIVTRHDKTNYWCSKIFARRINDNWFFA